MDYALKLLNKYIHAKTQFELTGITPEELQGLIYEEGRQRLLFVQHIIFCEEMTDKEKVETLVEWFQQE